MQKIIEAPLEEVVKTSYIDYALSVIIQRALPDLRDGLKPVQRRILFAMRELGLFADRPLRKSAKVTGEVTANYHPHGTEPVYESLVRLAQNFNLPHPLVEGQGNFGSIDGDPPAAERYTEVRLTKEAQLMLEDIDKDTVDFIPNYDNSKREPVVLPAKFPNTLVNGSYGIAVAMTTAIPPHNLSEVIDATLALIDNPLLNIKDLMEYIKGPDFPTGGIIINKKDLISIYEKGKGQLIVRGQVKVEAKKNKKILIIYEIPYQVNKSNLVSKIAQLYKEGKLFGILDLRDESNREGIRVVIELRDDVNEQIFINQLHKYTPLQTTISVNFLGVINNLPKTTNLKEMIEIYIEHRKNVVKRRTEYLLKEAERRYEILIGLQIAIQKIDIVIQIIKKAKDQEEAIKEIKKNLFLTDNQARAILQMQLAKLTKIEGAKINQEIQQLKSKIQDYKFILSSPKKILKIIKDELLSMKEYSKPRLTEIIDEKSKFTEEELIQIEDIHICLSRENYLKRLPSSFLKTYDSVNQPDDKIISIISSKTDKELFLFSDKAKIYPIKILKIPELKLNQKGISVESLFKLSKDEKIISTLEVDKSCFYLFVTERGYVYKKVGEDLVNLRAGSRCLHIKDEVIKVLATGDFEEGLFLTSTKRIGRIKITSEGKAVGLKDNERVIDFVILEDKADKFFIAFEGDYLKEFKIQDFTLKNMGCCGKKITIMKKPLFIIYPRKQKIFPLERKIIKLI